MARTDRGRRAAATACVIATAMLGCRHAPPERTPGEVVVDAESADQPPPRGDEPPKVDEPPKGDEPPKVDEVMPRGWNPGAPRWVAAPGSDPRLVVREGTTELGFLEQPCAEDDGCGCIVATEHRYTRRGAGWRIVVITPQVEFRRVVVEGTCGVGCGVQPPPTPIPVKSLGEVAPGDIEIVDERPHRVVEIKTCTNPMPRP